MDPAHKMILERDLPYELDMLERAFQFIVQDELADHPEIIFFRDMAFETFWVHARNVSEFMAQPRNVNATGVAAARDFTEEQSDMRYKLDERLINKINDQITHLRYERPPNDSGKLNTHDMERVYAALNSVVKEFETRLSTDARDLWEQREPKQYVRESTALNTTNETTSVKTTIGGFPGMTGTFRKA